ncbi:MAG TPA: glutathione peroxidase [Sphingobacteriaceae bacterium]|nr:glutathione peroxidase [Sphingobacteriaceae bacterium]
MLANTQPTDIYSFKVESIEGKTINLMDFKGKKILIVNTASKCGYTPQYKELEELSKLYKDKLVVIGFPANNFNQQEPGTNEDILEFCEKNYGVTFLLADKSSVKGEDINPLFDYLTKADNPDFKGEIKWNFEKFLIDENGKLIHRYRSDVTPLSTEITSKI